LEDLFAEGNMERLGFGTLFKPNLFFFILNNMNNEALNIIGRPSGNALGGFFLCYDYEYADLPGETPMSSKALTMIALMMIAFVFLAGCNLPSSTPTALASTPTVPASSTSPLPLSTATSAVPSATPVPSLTTTPVPDKLVFAAGATAGVATGTLQPGQTKSFTVSASQGQPLILILNSKNNDLYLGVLNPDASTLLDPAKKWNRLQWILPKSGVYTIQVIGGANTEDYILTVKIAAAINFASGSDTANLTGKTVNGLVISYYAYCTSGQTMTTNLNVPSTTAYLDVFGIAYGPLLSSSSKASTWSGVLPDSEAYIIEVIPTNGVEVSYQLSVKCH
jgi:hypothetical protein